MNKDILQAIMLAGEIPKNMQTTDNLVTEISSESTNEQYSSAKATYDASHFRLINSITLTSAAHDIYITKDSDGNDFKLAEIVVFGTIGYSASDFNYYQIWINGKVVTAANLPLKTLDNASAVNFRGLIVPGGFIMHGDFQDWLSFNATTAIRHQFKKDSYGDAITSINIKHAGGAAFATGSYIYVWGRE